MSRKNTARQQMGIPQDLFAAYLSVDRGLYSMYEARKRDLPFEASMKEGKIVIILANEHAPTPNYLANEQAENEKANKALRTHYQMCEIQLTNHQLEMEKLQEKAVQAKNTMLVVHHLLKDLPENHTDRLPLELMEIKAKEKLQRSGANTQKLLQVRIQSLEFEIDLIREMLG